MSLIVAARLDTFERAESAARAAGRRRNGEWVDFNPIRPAKLNPKIAQRAA